MSVDLNAYTPARYPVDGAIANSNTPATRLIQGMITRAFNAGGGIVELPAGAGTLMLDNTINLMSGVDIWIPKGCQVMGVPGLNVPFFQGDSVQDVRIFGGGWIIGPHDWISVMNYSGIRLNTCQEVTIDGIRIAGMPGSGILIVGDGYNHIHRVMVHDNGISGIYLDTATVSNSITDCWVYSNGQAGGATADGITIDHASLRTLITSLHAWEPGATFPAIQNYPVREVAASGSDYTLVTGLDSSGHVVSNTPSFAGANSKWLDSASTIALVGLPASVASAKVLGTSLNAAPTDHVHDIASGTTIPAPVISGRIQEDAGANVVAANDLTLGAGGNQFVTTGGTQINRLDSTGWQDGSVVTLIFSGAVTIKHNQTASGTLQFIWLSQLADFVAPANSTLTLRYSAQTPGWFEIGREVAGPMTFQAPVVVGRLVANTVGVSAKPLLNYVPVSTIVGQSISGTGDVAATQLTLTSLPSSAVAVTLGVLFSGATVGAKLTLRLHNGQDAIDIYNLSATIVTSGAGICPVTPGASNQIDYLIQLTSGGAWLVTLTITGYYEPA